MTEVTIPWTKGWVWGSNSVQRWCDQHCVGNYNARLFTEGGGRKIVAIDFEQEQDATMFLMFYRDDG